MFVVDGVEMAIRDFHERPHEVVEDGCSEYGGSLKFHRNAEAENSLRDFEGKDRDEGSEKAKPGSPIRKLIGHPMGGRDHGPESPDAGDETPENDEGIGAMGESWNEKDKDGTNGDRDGCDHGSCYKATEHGWPPLGDGSLRIMIGAWVGGS